MSRHFPNPPGAVASVLACFLAGCTVAPGSDQTTRATAPFAFQNIHGPPDAPPGTCWGKTTTPAVIETVTEQVLVQPANIDAQGTIRQAAIYRTETRQQIVSEREDSWFQTPCPDTITPEFVMSLQRALAARSLYFGPITGVYDAQTRASVLRFQKPNGTESGTLSLASAQMLGLSQVADES